MKNYQIGTSSGSEKKKNSTIVSNGLRPMLTTHIFVLLFFFLSLILPFSCLRFFSDLTANVTFLISCEFFCVTCVGIYSCGLPCDVFDTQYVRRNNMSRAMSRSGRPPLAGGSAVTEKQYSKLSRRGLAARRAADRAKLLANLAGDRAGGPATRSAGAPSTPSTPTSPQTRSERYALRSAEKSISKTLAESSSPDGSERYPSGAPAKLVDGDDDDDDDDEDDDDDNEDVDDCSSGGDQRMEFQRRQRDAASSSMAQLKPPPLEIVFQPPTNDPDSVVADSVLDMAILEPSPADSVMDDMFNAWRCGSCTYQNLGRAKGACNMCNDPHPLREGLSLDPWEISEVEAHSLRQVTASPPPPRRQDVQQRMSCASVLCVKVE